MTQPLVSNAADQTQVKRAKQREKTTREQVLNDLRTVLSTRQGRRQMWRTLSECGVFRLSFVPGDHARTDFNEGRRSIGLGLMADLHDVDPSLYLTMATEAATDEAIIAPAPSHTEE